MIETNEINYYNALAVDITAMNGVSFSVKLSKKDKVISLLGVNSKLKIGDKGISIDPLLLFQRIWL